MAQKRDLSKALSASNTINEDSLYIDEVLKQENLERAMIALADYNARLQQDVDNAQKELEESRSRIKQFRETEERNVRNKFSEIFSTEKGFTPTSKEQIVDIATHMLVKDIEESQNRDLDDIAYDSRTGSYFCSENCYDQDLLIEKLLKSKLPFPVVMGYVSDKRFGNGDFRKKLITAYIKHVQIENKQNHITKPVHQITKPQVSKISVPVKQSVVSHNNNNVHRDHDTSLGNVGNNNQGSPVVSDPEQHFERLRQLKSYIF